MKYVGLLAAFLVLVASLADAQEIRLSVSQRFDRRDTEEIPDFQKHVVPLLGRLGCNSATCHGSFQGQGGFQLSLFGFDFRADHAAMTAAAESRDGGRVNVKQAAQSLLVLKPSRQVDHEGGLRFAKNSWEHNVLLRWIEGGAKGAAVKKPVVQEADKNSTFSSAGIKLYRDRIQPLLENNCYECHGYDDPKGGLRLRRREQLLAGGKSGPALVPGKPDRSMLLQADHYEG